MLIGSNYITQNNMAWIENSLMYLMNVYSASNMSKALMLDFCEEYKYEYVIVPVLQEFLLYYVNKTNVCNGNNVQYNNKREINTVP